MNVYIDTSVVLSRLLNQSNQLKEWGDWENVYTSVITKVEFFRTVERLRLESQIDDEMLTVLNKQFNVLWETMHRIPVEEKVLARASAPFSTVVGTLDAIHLASALEAVPPEMHPGFQFLTHDLQLCRAAETVGFQVVGIG